MSLGPINEPLVIYVPISIAYFEYNIPITYNSYMYYLYIKISVIIFLFQYL